MAAKDSVYLGSDCDEAYVTKIADEHLEGLKRKIMECLSNTKEFAAYIQHVPGQPAQMVVSLGSNQGLPEHMRSAPARATREIRVKNLPDNADEEHLHMFFEYEKGQGGGPVKHVTLNNQDHTAVVEFREDEAVNIVLKKRPIKMLGVIVDVEAHTPYLMKDEPLKSIDIRGLPKDLIETVARLELEKSSKRENRDIKVGDKVRVKLSVQKPKFNWGKVTHDSVGKVSDIHGNYIVFINFPEQFVRWKGLLTEIELAE